MRSYNDGSGPAPACRRRTGGDGLSVISASPQWSTKYVLPICQTLFLAREFGSCKAASPPPHLGSLTSRFVTGLRPPLRVVLRSSILARFDERLSGNTQAFMQTSDHLQR